MCSRAQKLQQHTGVDTGLSRVTFRTVIDGYGHIVWWAMHNSGFFLLLSNLQTTFGCLPPTSLLKFGEVVSLQESFSLFNEVGDRMLYASALSWLLRSRIRSLQLRTSKCLQWRLSNRLRQLAFSICGNPGLGSPGQQLTSIALQLCTP